MTPTHRSEDFKFEFKDGPREDARLFEPGTETHTFEAVWNPVNPVPFFWESDHDYRIIHQAPLWMRILLPWRRWVVFDFKGRPIGLEDDGVEEVRARINMRSAPETRYTFRRP